MAGSADGVVAADNNGDDVATTRRRTSIYVTERDMLSIISSDRFSVPVTMSTKKYTSYRGRHAATVITLRFNVTSPDYSVAFMSRNVIHVLDEHFSLQMFLTCCADYDFVLRKSNSNSYYIWQANSNRARYNETNEVTMNFTHANVKRFCEEAAQVSVPDLELNFLSSDCIIDRLLAITISFIF